MWLTLDIGNSSIKGGLFEDGALRYTFRLNLPAPADTNTLAALLASHASERAITRVGISSVIPGTTPIVIEAVEHAFGLTPYLVGADMPLPFAMAYETPHTLGADRLAAAAAGWVLFGRPQPARSVVVIDAGTAVTFEVVSQDGRYLGGVIAPGPHLLQRALHHGTAQLPAIPLEFPGHIVGRSTREAIQSGVMYGFADAVLGMLGRIGSLLEDSPAIVLTGGWASALKPHLDDVAHMEPDLVLHGIRILMEQSD